MGGLGQKPQNGKPTFINLLILEHLKNYFIELPKYVFWCALKLMVQKLLNWPFWGFLPRPPFIYTTLIAVETFLLLKQHLLSINLHEFP